jgi:glycosyltransferase involved in cell wall biosynthesis
VVVPIYKVEKYIDKCINSIINQTYKNLEIILVDDGSPDNCPQICDEYAKKDNRIKVIHKENGGLSDARNRGIKEARGEYIGFVDSDDYIDDGMYEYLYNLIKKHNAEISICGFKEVDENGKAIKEKKSECINEYSSIEALEILAEDIIITNHAWNKLYKRELFVKNSIEYPVGKIMEDISTTYKLFEESNRIVLGDEIQYYYLIRETSISGEKGLKMCKYHIENTIDRFEHFKDNKELGFYFYKNLFYVAMRAFLDYGEAADKYIDDNKTIEKVVLLGKEYGYYDMLSRKDKIRLLLLKKNRKLYKKIMQLRRRVIQGR